MCHRSAAMLAILLCLRATGQDAKPPSPGSLTIEDVVRLAQANVSDDLIIARVRRNAKSFDLNSDEIVALRNLGVSEAVIKYMVDPSQPYAPPAPPAPVITPSGTVVMPAPAPAIVPPKPPADPLVLKLPGEQGIYYLKGTDQFIGLDPKTVVPDKQPGKISKLSGGLVKGHVLGSVAGATAQIRIKSGNAIFYIRPPEKAAIEDFALVRTERGKDRRDLDFGTKPGKPVLPVSSVLQIESKQVSPGIFRVSATISEPGEYFFYILGTADEKKGMLGKGYDVGVD